MTATPHCQGCGAVAGSHIVYRKQPKSSKRRGKQVEALASLTPITFVDFGVRWFCQSCLIGAQEEAWRLTALRHTLAVRNDG